MSYYKVYSVKKATNLCFTVSCAHFLIKIKNQHGTKKQMSSCSSQLPAWRGVVRSEQMTAWRGVARSEQMTA